MFQDGRICAVFDVYYIGYRPITCIDRDIKRSHVSAEEVMPKIRRVALFAQKSIAISSEENNLNAADICSFSLGFPAKRNFIDMCFCLF